METKKATVKKVLDYMEENLEQEINVEKIAADAGYSKFYLNRIFSQYTGITIHKYLQNRRLTAAAEKLVCSDLPIAQIACEAGYESQQAFTLAFKRLYLQPPKVYRTAGIFTPRQNRISLCGYSRPVKSPLLIRLIEKNQEAAA